MKIRIELELEDVFFLFAWRKHDNQTFTPMGIESSRNVDKVIDKIADQVEPIIEGIEADAERRER